MDGAGEETRYVDGAGGEETRYMDGAGGEKLDMWIE